MSRRIAKRKEEIEFTDQNGTPFTLSDEFINVMKNESDFTIIAKLREDSNNIIVSALSKSENKIYTLLIDKNYLCMQLTTPSNGAALISKMQEEGELNTNSIVQVYENFTLKNIK